MIVNTCQKCKRPFKCNSGERGCARPHQCYCLECWYKTQGRPIPNVPSEFMSCWKDIPAKAIYGDLNSEWVQLV